jgi:hypothetical protein
VETSIIEVRTIYRPAIVTNSQRVFSLLLLLS